MNTSEFGHASYEPLNHYSPEKERADDDDETKVERLEKAIQHALSMGGSEGEDRVEHLLLDQVDAKRREIDEIMVEHEYGPDDGEWRMEVSAREEAIEYVLGAIDNPPVEGEPTSPLERAINAMSADLEGLQEDELANRRAIDQKLIDADPDYYGRAAGAEFGETPTRKRLSRKIGSGSVEASGLDWNNPDPVMVDARQQEQNSYGGRAA